MSKIIRSKRDTPFVQIDKTGPEDERLSWKAKGILAYILCKPDDWQIYVTELSKHAKDGKDATASGINELIKFGYIVRKRQHTEDGKFAGYDYQVFESPINTTVSGKSRHGKRTVSGKPVNGLSVNGKPVSGKPATTNNNSTNNNLTEERKNENAHAKNPEKNPKKEKPELTADQTKNNVPPVAAHPPREKEADDSFLTEPIPDLGQPHWTEVATKMAEYFKDENGFGPTEWKYMCDSAGGRVDPMVITTIWAGKAEPYELLNWKKHTGKLTNWIKNNLKSDRTTEAKIKSLNKGNTNERLKVGAFGNQPQREIVVSKVPL